MVSAFAPQGATAASGSSTNPKPENNDSSSSGGSIYEDALDRLQPLQPILHGFNHRNRNQHRRASWWAAFGMLRRHTDKLVDELLEYTSAAEAAAKSKSKKRKRIDGKGEDKAEKRAEKKVRDHVEWMRDVLVPKCYLAFSQLTADNQFAALGVVLLGALAQVNAACTKIVGEAVEPAGARQELGFATPGIGGIPTKGRAGSSDKDSDICTGHDETLEGLDRQGGAVISRDEVAKAEKLRRKNTNSGGKTQSRTLNNDFHNLSSSQHHDDAASIEKPQKQTSKPYKEADEGTSKEAKPAKKKKKTKKGDEFDNLFKGLF